MFASKVLATAILVAVANAVPFQGTRLCDRRQVASSYDYVVVGGGASGLTLANRLSEDSCKSRRGVVFSLSQQTGQNIDFGI